jgi:hypothetical protein
MCNRRQQPAQPLPGAPSVHGSEAPAKIIYLGACLIAAVRLAREEKWDNSPRVASRIADSVELARKVWERIAREPPLSRD